MIDYLHIEFIDTPAYIFTNNSLLEFRSDLNIQTGELIKNRYGYYNQIAFYDNLKIEISTNILSENSIISLKGSIHKFAQQNTNYKDFTFQNITDTIIDLCNKLNVVKSNCILHHLEFGLNVDTIHLADNVLNSMIICKGIGYEKKEFNKTGYLKSFEFSQYKIKVYNKGLQYDLIDNLLRFEVKSNRMQYLNSKGIEIRSFDDLLNPKIYNSLLQVITDNLDNILFFDYRLNVETIKDIKDKFLLIKGANPDYWLKVKKEKSNNTYCIKRNEFRKLVKQYAPSDLKLEIKTTIINKWNYLLNGCTNLPRVENNKVVRIYSNIVSNTVQPSKYCLSCGKDISHQRSISKYCRFKIDGKENKDCKNYATNFFEHDLKMYPKYQLHLLDIDNYLQPDRLRLKQTEFSNYRCK
jgi:hypothetical protein